MCFTSRALACAATVALAILSPGTNDASAQEMLTLHNAKRNAHCAPPLAWSSTLAAAAQSWANRCQFVHSPRESRPNQGENLAWGSGSFASAASSVERWYAEVSKYNFSSPGFSPATGHFTQIVWRGSLQIGCAVAACGGQNFWVCRYSPAGNITNPGQFAQNVLPTTCQRGPAPAAGASLPMCPSGTGSTTLPCRCFPRRYFRKDTTYTYARLDAAGNCPAGFRKIGTSNPTGPSFTGPCRRSHYKCIPRRSREPYLR